MRDDVRRSVEGALGKLSPGRAQDLARAVAQGGGREQVSKIAQELTDWSTRNRERVRGLVAREVRQQLKAMGLATREEVEALRRRVRELERVAPNPTSSPGNRSAGPTSASVSSPTKAKPARSSSAKRTAKRAPSKP